MLGVLRGIGSMVSGLFGSEIELMFEFSETSFHVVIQSHRTSDSSEGGSGRDYLLLSIQGRVRNNGSRGVTLSRPRLECDVLDRFDDLSFDYEPDTEQQFHNQTTIHLPAQTTEAFTLRRTIRDFTVFDAVQEIPVRLGFDCSGGQHPRQSIVLQRTENSHAHGGVTGSLSSQTVWGEVRTGDVPPETDLNG